MKSTLKSLLLSVLSIFLVTGSAMALPMDSVPILIVDGDDDGTTVTLAVLDGTSAFDFGYLYSGSFIPLGSGLFDGGDIIDFAIRDISNQNIYSLGTDASGNNYCRLDFSGEIDASYSANPVVSHSYWSAVNMHWGIPTAIPGHDEDIGFSLAMAVSNSHDGLAAAVPEPATLLLLGTGLVGLAGLGRKKFF